MPDEPIRVARQSTSANSGEAPCAATSQWHWEDGDWVVVEVGPGQVLLTGKERTTVSCFGGEDAMDQSFRSLHVQCAATSTPTQRTDKHAKRAPMIDHQPAQPYHTTACSSPEEAKAQLRLDDVQFTATAKAAYSSLSELEEALRQVASHMPVVPMQIQTMQQKASEKLSLASQHLSQLYMHDDNLGEPDRAYCQCYTGFPCEVALDDSSSVISDSSSKAPTDVHEYFRCHREVFLIKEKLVDLTIDQAGNAGPEVDFNDEMFEAKRKELTSALEIAQREVDAQLEACHERGVDPERFRHRRISSRPSNYNHVTAWLKQHIDN